MNNFPFYYKIFDYLKLNLYILSNILLKWNNNYIYFIKKKINN
jgi:hypothetical protein